MSEPQNILIIGCGRLGSRLANRLSVSGHYVVVVDKRKSMFEKLSFDFSGYTVVGDATEFQVLRDAKISQADYVFAATRSDNTNLMVAQVAREMFEVPTVLARVYDPAREAVYQALGVRTISPTNLTANEFLGHVDASRKSRSR
ncbi:MAG: TrkA family potassium uptake protein [Chloroflexota bacterium]